MSSLPYGKIPRIEHVCFRRLKNLTASILLGVRHSKVSDFRGKRCRQNHSASTLCRRLVPPLIQDRREQSPYNLSVLMQVDLCVRRGYERLRGDMAVLITGVIFNAIMALVIGSVFFDLANDTGSIYSRGALIFFSILLAAFASSSEVSRLVSPESVADVIRSLLCTHNARLWRSMPNMPFIIRLRKRSVSRNHNI